MQNIWMQHITLERSVEQTLVLYFDIVHELVHQQLTVEEAISTSSGTHTNLCTPPLFVSFLFYLYFFPFALFSFVIDLVMTYGGVLE